MRGDYSVESGPRWRCMMEQAFLPGTGALGVTLRFSLTDRILPNRGRKLVATPVNVIWD